MGVGRQRQVQRDDVAGGRATPACGTAPTAPPAGQPVVAGAGVQHGGAHRGDDVARRVWRCCRSRPARRCRRRYRGRSRRAAGSDGQPRPSRVARSSAGRRRRAASISSTVPSATDGALAPGILATAIPRSVAVCDVDGVHPGAEFVHQPQPRPAPQVGAGQRPQHMPNHLGLGQLPVEGCAVESSSAHHRISSQSDFRRKEIQHFVDRERNGRGLLSATAWRSTWRWCRPARCARPGW